MAKRKRKQTKKKETIKKQLQFEVVGLTMFALMVIGIIKLGKVGGFLVMIFRFFFGEWYVLPLLGGLIFSLFLIVKRSFPPFATRRLNGLYLMGASMLLLSHVKLFEDLSRQGDWADLSVIRNTFELFKMETGGQSIINDLGGGMIGAGLFAMSYYLFDVLGTRIIAFLLILISLLLITGKSLRQTVGVVFSWIGDFIKKQWGAFLDDISTWKEGRKKKREEKELERQRAMEQEELEISGVRDESGDDEEEEAINGDERDEEPIIANFADVAYQKPEKGKRDASGNAQPQEKAEDQEGGGDVTITFSEQENKDYRLPPLSLLEVPQKNSQTFEKQQISANARKLEKTFQSFGVKARVAKVHLGPAVTKYEVYPEAGVKVSKIVNLSDDLALALAAKDIRIEAPIPGKSAVGIEVPNQEVATVSLREVLESPKNDMDKKLMIGLGRDISGDAVLAELNKMPHLLVAGATGSGKSVCINGIVTSILMKTKPHEVKLMMIDPKMVELNVYNGIPHLLAPVVTDAKKASQALKKVVAEMERRYDLFSHSGTRNIEGYNEHVRKHNEKTGEKQPLLPFIVVIVDELADLMMVASGDVEDAITRLAQMARAAGIHLIIATQRPSVDVITGVIKANIPSRIAFSVSSQTDSRTILDMGGADKLLGRGDMLFLPVGASKPIRIQGAFLSDEEVEEIVDYVVAQQKAQYQEEMIPSEETEDSMEVDDDLYPDAVELVTEMQTASVSMLQRRFRVGYTRAARLIDAMEANGVVGPYEGSKPREVLVSKNNEEATS
ncbi:DNA translocase FtsK [Bacillus marinisedimentorum]|uniref:DNA translocase FtsK n=1 Tax=Bacillus marinisedimentorum TaxID=1821260 RepID=UPI0007DF2C92|nr:DNA translocase FtsK [Bacillus marinisedimentorum]